MSQDSKLCEFRVNAAMLKKLKEDDDVLFKVYIWFSITSRMCNTLTNLCRLFRINTNTKCDGELLKFLANISFAYTNEVFETFINLWNNYSDVIERLKVDSPSEEFTNSVNKIEIYCTSMYKKYLDAFRNKTFHFCSKKRDFDEVVELYNINMKRNLDESERFSVIECEDDPFIYIQGIPIKMWDEAVEKTIMDSDVEKAQIVISQQSTSVDLIVTDELTSLEKIIRSFYISMESDITPICQSVLDIFLFSLIKNGVINKINE